MSTSNKKPRHNRAGKKTLQGGDISEGFANPDDPEYKEGWHIHIGPSREKSSVPTKPTLPAATKGNPASSATTEAQVTGFDFMANWPEEIQIIHNHGPFTPSELDELTEQQLGDYYYLTSWFLRLEGRESVVTHRQELRDLLEKHWTLPYESGSP